MVGIVEIATMEPPSKGHFGTNHSVHCREDVLFSEVSKQLLSGHYKVPFMRGCSFSEGPLSESQKQYKRANLNKNTFFL